MATVIDCNLKKRGAMSPLSRLRPFLSPLLYMELESYSALPEELRLRSGRAAYITSQGRNIRLSHTVTEAEINGITEKLCGGSLYAHRETIAEGYITLEGGIRVGICGRAVCENGNIIGVYDICGLNFRLPMYKLFCTERLLGILREGKSLLIYSPPGVGKTTLLRGIAYKMSSGTSPVRVCVIDTREEIGVALTGEELSLDVLSGYPKEKGIELAVRTMSPQLIICDEIGSEAEARALLGAQGCGVPIVATAHGREIASLLTRKGIGELHGAKVFDFYVGLERSGGKGDMAYDIVEWERANELL